MNNVNKPSRSFMVLPGMKPAYTSDPKHAGETRLPGFGWLPNRLRHIFISMLGEFVGTFLFLFFAFAGTQVANTPPGEAGVPPSVATLLYISLSFGFSLAVNVWIFFRISGGLFNPAVSVALALVGAISWLKAGLLIVSQILAGISAAGIVSALFPGELTVRTTLNPNTSVVRGLFIEVLLTSELIFTIFMLAAEKHRATFLAPIGIGLALFITLLAGVYFSGGSLNPARSFGPDVILRTFDDYHWIYWVGPLLGAIVAVIFYRFIKVLEYETANPGADSDGQEGRFVRSSSTTDDVNDGTRTTWHTTTTDGADESEFHPPICSVDRLASSSHYTATSAGSGSISLPARPLPIYQHGVDGHRSESESESESQSSVDHPNERPRAHHSNMSSRSSRSHYTEESERSFHDGPTLESSSSGSGSGSASRSRRRTTH